MAEENNTRLLAAGAGAAVVLAYLSSRAGGEPGPGPDPDPGGEVDVEFTATSLSTNNEQYRVLVNAADQPEKLTEDERLGAEDSDRIIECKDGKFIVQGATGTATGEPPAYGDSFAWTGIEGPDWGIHGFDAHDSINVQINGQEVPASNLPDWPSEYTCRDSTSGAWWVTGEPTGGHAEDLGGGPHFPGKHYTSDDGDYIVSTAQELRDALDQAAPGEVVFVADDIQSQRWLHFDNSGYAFVEVPAGVTLAGDRGVNGSRGPRIYAGDEVEQGMVRAGNDAHITGLRFEGGFGGRAEPWAEHEYNWTTDIGVQVVGSNVEISNCEMYHFGHAGIRGEGAHIHHCDIHHNPLHGLGYGVSVGSGHAVIERCSMNFNKHSIAQFGGGDWTFKDSWHGPLCYNHILDFHDPGDCVIRNVTVEAEETQGPGADPSRGDWITQECTTLRARNGLNSLTIEDSWFFQDRIINEGQRQYMWLYVSGGLPGDTTLRNNAFQETPPDPSIGHPR